MEIKSLFTLVMSAMLVLPVVSSCKNADSSTSVAQATEQQTLVMGTSADFPPYEFRDTSAGSNEIIGFDIDVAQYIADKLDFELEIKDQKFDGLISALQSKRVDFVISSMSPTEERKKNVDFSDVYFIAQKAILVKVGSNLTKSSDLINKKLGVQLGTTDEKQAQAIAKEVKGLQVIALDNSGELIQQLKTGRVDAVLIADVVAKNYVKTNPDLEFHVTEVKGNLGSAVAFPKDSERVDDFNQVIREMKENGEMEKLVTKWFAKP